jgi:hypothetical protein
MLILSDIFGWPNMARKSVISQWFRELRSQVLLPTPQLGIRIGSSQWHETWWNSRAASVDTFCWKIIILYTHTYIYYKNQKWFTTHYYQISHMICNQQSRIYNGKPKLRGQETAPTLATMHPRIANKQPVLVINPWLLAVSHRSGGW